MPLTFSQLKARAATLTRFEGWSDTSPAPDFSTLVNRAYEMFCWDSELFLVSESISTVNGQAEYTTTNHYKALLDVTLAGNGLLRSTEEFERNLSPGWRTQTAGTPVRWVLSNYNKVTLVPPPSSVQTLALRGIALPTALSAESDVPAVPAIYHESIAIKAAILHAEIYAQGEAVARLARLEEVYNRHIMQARTSNLYGYQRRDVGEG